MRKALFPALTLAILIGLFNYSGHTFIEQIGFVNIIIGLVFLVLNILIIIKLWKISDDISYIKEVIKSNQEINKHIDQDKAKHFNEK
jgi:hypothetical protein